jgi:hypothetical protein
MCVSNGVLRFNTTAELAAVRRGKSNCNRWKYMKQEVDERNKISKSAGMPDRKYTSQKNENIVCRRKHYLMRERGYKN